MGLDTLLTETGLDMVSHPEGITLYSAIDDTKPAVFMCDTKKECRAFLLGVLYQRKGV